MSEASPIIPWWGVSARGVQGSPDFVELHMLHTLSKEYLLMLSWLQTGPY
jgi:hypothetical protein